MSSDFRIEGLDSMRSIARDLKEIESRKLIRKEFNDALRKDVVPALEPYTSAAALAMLPKKGGLNVVIANTLVSTRSNTSSEKYAGIDLVAGRKGSGAGGADRGRVRHPLFGDRTKFYETNVHPGWFTDTVKAHMNVLVPIVDRAIQALLDRVGTGRM